MKRKLPGSTVPKRNRNCSGTLDFAKFWAVKAGGSGTPGFCADFRCERLKLTCLLEMGILN
jgi:hypothetical protein